MTKRRADGFSIDEALGDPGFTPRQKDVPRLLDRIVDGDDEARSRAEKALLRVQSSVAPAIVERAETATVEGRARLFRVAAQVAARPDETEPLRELFVRHLASDDARTRRAAATALGRVRGAASEDALLAALTREERAQSSRDPNVLEAIVGALGKVGAERSSRALATLEGGIEGGASLDRARLMLERTTLRTAASRLHLDRALGEPVAVTLRCRSGLATWLAAEVAEKCPSARSAHAVAGDAERVDLTLHGPPARLFAARTFLTLGFALEGPRRPGEELVESIVHVLSSDASKRILHGLTEGPIRFRLGWASGGKRRKATWDVAREIARRAPELVNDPTESLWEVVVRESTNRVRLELSPRGDDPRFSYRGADVPAASHPTLAAAIVRAAGVREDDVVWDPFVGSGGELAERHLAGPAAMLIGSDVDERALRAARTNLDRAGATSALLRKADARSFDPRAIGGRARLGMSAILSNPPMGRRVARGEDLEHLLARVVVRAADVLIPGGRLVWLSPLPRVTRAVAKSAGLSLRHGADVDMGGFSAGLQILDKPGAR